MKPINNFFKIGLYILIFLMTINFGLGALTDNITSYYKLDETSGTISLNSHNQTLNGTMISLNSVTGIIGNAYNFSSTGTPRLNASTIATESAYDFDRTTAYTVSGWFKLSSNGFGTNNRIVFNKADGGFAIGITLMFDTNNKLIWYHRDSGTGEDSITTVGTFTDTNFHHLVAVYDGSDSANGMKIYIDGANVSTTVVLNTVSATILNNQPFIIGNFDPIVSPPTSFPMLGILDEVGVWKRNLSQAEITQLYNSGNGLTYPFSTTVTNETLTLRSNYSNIALSNYSARVVASGAYDKTFNDTAGTITLDVLQNDTRLFNITYTKGGWFNKTYNNVNISTAHTGYVEQSYINFSLRQQITNNSYTNYTIKLNGTVVCNTTTAFCQITYPDAGFYLLNATPNNGVEFHALNTNITISALQNETIYLYTHDHNVNIQARDSITNASILIYNVTSQSYNRTDVRTTGTTNGNVSVDVIHDTYNFTVDAPGYALYNNVQNLTVTSEHNLTFYLQRTNGVAISIFNEANGSSLNGVDVTVYVYIDNSTLVYTNVTNTSTISYYNLTAGNYTFRFEATNYAVKEYYVNVGNRSFQYLNAYMLQTSSSTIFTFLDQTNGNVIDGVNVIVKKYINGSLVVVSSLTSDITGRVQLSYQANTPYYFTCTKGDYDNKEFTLNPILFSTYTVKMTPSVSEVYEADYSGVSITHTPQRLYTGQNNRLFFTFGSPAGKFVLYGFNVTYNGTTNGTTGVNAYGEIIDAYININNARIGQTAQVQYFYTTSDGATNHYAFNMEIVGQTMNTNNTVLANKDQTYGLGLFERVFIITIILIIMAGAGALYGGALIGSAIAIFILGIFSYLGFIPWFIGYPTMLFLFIYIVWGSSK